jgi:restriction endonuclease S subunit/predicted nucleotidyltransferase
MKYGLSQTVIEKICAVFARFSAIEKAVLYGSRAKGNFKAGSDIDLTLFGENLAPAQSGEIAEMLDDLLLPYTIDLSIYAELNHAKLQEHIDRVGVVFYERASAGQYQGVALKGWQTKPFEDCIKPVKYTRKIQRKDFLDDGQYPIVSQEAEFTNGSWDDAADVFKVSTPVVIFGDHTQVLKYVDFDFVLGADGVKVLPPRDFLLPKFFYYQLQATNFASLGYSRHYRLLKELEIKYPPLTEQQRIVGLLDEAFESLATAKANAEKNLQNAHALFESHLQSVFTQRGPGWVEKKVSEIAKHSLGKMLDKAKNKGEPQPYLRNINVRWFTFDLSDLLQMPFLAAETEKYTAVKGDVFICEGGYPGRAAIWNEDYPIHFQKALHRVRFHEPEHNKWFIYYLSNQDFSGQLKLHFSGTGIQHFTGEVLARFTMPVPPLAELRRAVAKFDVLADETQRLALIYKQKLAALDALKKSLLHQAFTGQL